MPTFTRLQRRIWAMCGPKPAKIYYTNGGIGDELMLTAIAAAARAAGRPLALLATYPELWRGNSDPASLHLGGVERWHYASQRGWIATEVVHLHYQGHYPAHIAEQMAAHTGVPLPAGWRPVLYPKTTAARDPRLDDGRERIHEAANGFRAAHGTGERLVDDIGRDPKAIFSPSFTSLFLLLA